MKGTPHEIKDAAKDLCYLLDRDYRRASALCLIAARYDLTKAQRNYLVRYCFSKREIRDHKSRRIPLRGIKGKDIVVDTYNVLITVESILSEKEVVMGMDGFLRDVSAVFSSYRLTEKTKKSLDALLTVLSSYRPRNTLFILDSQMSRSGELAEYIRSEMQRRGIEGDARTSRAADHDIKTTNRIALTSDSAIIESVAHAADICAEIRKRRLHEIYTDNPNNDGFIMESLII